MLRFIKRELLLTSKVRHSTVGWNPVHRIFKHLDGLGPSLRWDDGLLEVPKNEKPPLTGMPGHKWLETPIYTGSTSFLRLLLHQLLLLSLPVFLFFCIALVVLLFAFCQTDLELDAAALVMQI